MKKHVRRVEQIMGDIIKNTDNKKMIKDQLRDMRRRDLELGDDQMTLECRLEDAIRDHKFDIIESIERGISHLNLKRDKLNEVGAGILREFKEQYPEERNFNVYEYGYGDFSTYPEYPNEINAFHLYYRDGSNELFSEHDQAADKILKRYKERGGDMEFVSDDGCYTRDVIDDHLFGDDDGPDPEMILKVAGVERIVRESWRRQ